jgi:hypothetical protein
MIPYQITYDSRSFIENLSRMLSQI